MRLRPQAGLSFAAILLQPVWVSLRREQQHRHERGIHCWPRVTPAPLADAAQRQDKQAVQALLAKKADVNATQPDGATALHWAAYAQDAESTAQLIRAGANVNVRNNYGVSPLALAAKNGNANIIGQLMKAGADPNDPSTT